MSNTPRFNIRQFRQKRFLLPAILILLGLVAVGLAAFWPKPGPSQSSVQVTPATDKCPAANNITFSCYRQELDDLVTAQGPVRAFDLVKQQYDKIPYVKSQCHQLTHVIGRAAYAKYGNLSETFTHGDQFCWSGYYHGVMEELSKEKGKQTIAQANSICADLRSKQPQSFYHYNCVHGLGHGFMFILNQKLFPSLDACDTLKDSFERTSCYGGAFMQNIMNEQAPDRDEVVQAELRPSEPMYPCTAVKEQYKGQCYLMQTSYALQVENYDFAKVFGLCSQVETTYRDTCYQSLGRDASGNSISDVDQTKAKCLLGPSDEAKSYCIRGAAYDFVSYFHSDQQAHKLCASLPAGFQTDCRQSVDTYYQSF